MRYAQDAVTSYVESTKNVRNTSWTYSLPRIERALRLSLSLGMAGENNRDVVISYIRDVLENHDLHKEAYFPLKLIRLLLDVKYDDSVFCISILEKSIQFFENEKDIRRLSDYLELLAQWYDKNDEIDKAIEMRRTVAEKLVEAQIVESSAIGKARCLQQAIEIYRRIGNNKDRVYELHKELLQIQKNIPSEMKFASTGYVDISASVEASSSYVSDLSTRDALIKLCYIVKPTDIKHTYDVVEKQAKQFIHTFLFGRYLINKDGKTVGQSPELSNNSFSKEERYYSHLVDQLGLKWELNVLGAIIPAKEQIILEHQIEESDLKEFIANNPLIRCGHEALFMQGILFGFDGKWDLAIQILAIQFEDSIRYLLEKKGILTSSLQTNFVQDEKNINHFFKEEIYSRELREIFGEDIFCELKALLCKDDHGSGFNLRNLVAHALMTHDEFYSNVCVYFWWLVFRLLCTPVIITDEKMKENK